MDSNRKSSITGFAGKKFYFDLINSPVIAQQLTRYINQLGGEVKSFLDQKIKYIITNRPKEQWPPKVDTSAKTRHSLPSESLKDHIIQSPINLNKNSSFSRGKLLLSAIAKQSISKSSLPTDILERGRYWNIKILGAVDVLKFCRKRVSPVATDNTTVSPTKVQQLRGAFIKLVDRRLQHRPAYKELLEWPQINYEYPELMGSPFFKTRVQKHISNEPIVESLEGLVVKNRLNDNTNNGNKKVVKSKQKSSANNKPIVGKNSAKKPRIPPFCEICGTDYEDLIEHLKSETHEMYIKDEENFTELKGVIQSLLPFETNNGVKGIDSDTESDSCDNSDDERPIRSPFQSSSNISVFKFSGSKHKSHFLSIHDLIGKDSPQPIHELSEEQPSEYERQSSETELVLIPSTSPNRKAIQECNQISNSRSYDLIHISDENLDSNIEIICISKEL